MKTKRYIVLLAIRIVLCTAVALTVEFAVLKVLDTLKAESSEWIVTEDGTRWKDIVSPDGVHYLKTGFCIVPRLDGSGRLMIDNSCDEG